MKIISGMIFLFSGACASTICKWVTRRGRIHCISFRVNTAFGAFSASVDGLLSRWLSPLVLFLSWRQQKVTIETENFKIFTFNTTCRTANTSSLFTRFIRMIDRIHPFRYTTNFQTAAPTTFICRCLSHLIDFAWQMTCFWDEGMTMIRMLWAVWFLSLGIGRGSLPRGGFGFFSLYSSLFCTSFTLK